MTLFVSDYLHKYFHTIHSINHLVSTIFTDKSSELMYVNSKKWSGNRLHNLNCLTDGKYFDQRIFRVCFDICDNIYNLPSACLGVTTLNADELLSGDINILAPFSDVLT